MTAQEIHSFDPLNREPPLPPLVSSFLTSKDGYSRNHSSIPQINASTHQIRVDGAVAKSLTLSMSDLASFPQKTVVCALQCAGNRRRTMRTRLGEINGIEWADGAVMNSKWRGPLLSSILEAAGGCTLPEPARSNAHVAFACHAVPTQEDSYYGGSIPLSRALVPDADVLLATHMNDEPLTAEHGFPVRIITPGIAGARSVKWLDQITVQKSESENFYQKRDYKVLPPEVTDAEKAEKGGYWESTPALMEMPVNSVVCLPLAGSTVARTEEGKVVVEGWALPSGENGPVTKVEVSGDEGKTWADAQLLAHADHGKWAWQLWKALVDVAPGKCRLVYSRATDKAGNVQDKDGQWNLRGCAYNGYGMADELHVI